MIKYILLIVLIAITIINFYSFTIGKKIKKNNELQFLLLQKKLEEKSLKIIEKEKILVNSKHFFVSDINEGFLLILDNAKKLVLIISDDTYNTYLAKDIVACKSIFKKNKNVLLQSSSIIETNDSEYEFTFGTKKRKANSVLGKFIIDTTDQFTDLINDFIK